MKSEEQWKASLSPEQYRVLRQKGTEPPGTGKFNKHDEDGVYTCGGCGQQLFTSDAKYNSGCGWPSFTKPVEGGAVVENRDVSHGMVRTEIVCSNCGGHLGHVFDDGPDPTGLRYCINSLSLGFTKPAAGGELETATFAGGCFWCVEAVFENLDGVKSVVSGYTGGRTPNPTYREVCGGGTGHAEAVRIEFDPAVISYEELLKHFWRSHDPTTPNRQGADVGSQYRSAIFYHSPAQKAAAERSLEHANQEVFDGEVVTQLAPAETFHEAEDYHQDYFERNSDAPYCQAVIAPKIRKLGL